MERFDGASIGVAMYVEPVEDEGCNIVAVINCFHEISALHHN
jgi:hypothetical protein